MADYIVFFPWLDIKITASLQWRDTAGTKRKVLPSVMPVTYKTSSINIDDALQIRSLLLLNTTKYPTL
jgi:hypothetical protein